MDNHKRFERQLRAWIGMINDGHLLHKTSVVRLGELAVFSNPQKPTQRVKENEETKEYISNKRIR